MSLGLALLAYINIFTGLEETYDWVKSFRNDYASYLSLADVMVFVGIEALKIASIRASKLRLKFI